jgi:hypothetical protein
LRAIDDLKLLTGFKTTASYHYLPCHISQPVQQQNLGAPTPRDFLGLQSSGDDPCLVEHQDIIRVEIVGKLVEKPMLHMIIVSIKHE